MTNRQLIQILSIPVAPVVSLISIIATSGAFFYVAL